MLWIGIGPCSMQHRIGEFAAFFLIKRANPQENLRQDVLIDSRVARRWYGGVLPLQPARRVRHGPVFFREARARQAVHRGIDTLSLVRCRSWSPPEFARFIGIDF